MIFIQARVTLFLFISVLLLWPQETLKASTLQSTNSSSYPTKGGEGGKILAVTTLNDSGPGSLREAVESEEPRIIHFAVGGEIWLKKNLKITKPFVTIAGETAPSPGITLMGDQIKICTHDLILRHIRVRVGALSSGSPPDNRDGIAIEKDWEDVKNKAPSYNILIENCSVSWSIDELVEVWGKKHHDIVIRNCILAEALSQSIHPKGKHSAGLLIGTGIDKVTVQGNLFAHNSFRNPVICSGSTGIIVNNLIYDPGFSGIHFYGRDGADAVTKLMVNVLGNVVIAGPSTRPDLGVFHEKGLNAGSKIYMENNEAIGTLTFDKNSRPPEWAAEGPSPFVSEMPLPLPDFIKVLSPSEVKASVLAQAGARPSDRDEVDKRIIDEVKTGTGKIRDEPTDLRLTSSQSLQQSGNKK